MAQGGQATERKLTAAEKRSQALQLRKAGATYEQIGEQVGITKQMAHKYVRQALEELNNKTAEEAEELRRLESERLDALLLAVYPQAKQGHQGAIDRVLKIMERRARLHGLDGPTKSEISGPDGGPIEYDYGGMAALAAKDKGDDGGE